MKLSGLISSLLLYSLASAFPFTAPRVGQTLAVRQEDDEICSRETCGAICARTPTPQVRTLGILKGLASSFITKRALEKPQPGGLDAWFASTWPMVENKLDIEPDYAEVYYENKGQPTQSGLVGMSGCTSVLVATHKGVLLTHMWEKYFNDDKRQSGASQAFVDYVLSPIRDSLSCKFSSSDPGLQITIYTRANQVPDTMQSQPLFYPEQVAQLKEEILDAIEGLDADRIKVVQYKASGTAAADLSKANGKIIYTYTNDDEGQNAYQLWVGSMMDAGNTRMLASSEINEPIMSDKW